MCILRQGGGAHESCLQLVSCPDPTSPSSREERGQQASMAYPGVKCELVAIISAFEILNKIVPWALITFYLVYCVYYEMLSCHFSTDSSCHAHSEGTFKWARFSRELVFAWNKVGPGRSRTPYDWTKPPWRQWALQTRDVGSMASKYQTSHMESSRWCSSSDGRG